MVLGRVRREATAREEPGGWLGQPGEVEMVFAIKSEVRESRGSNDGNNSGLGLSAFTQQSTSTHRDFFCAKW